VRSNPYELCFRVDGFGFKRADVVAQRVGIGKDSVERMIAGVIYTLDTAIMEGHCSLWGGQLQRMAADVLGLDAAVVGRGIGEAWRRGYVVRRGKRIYSQRLERAELECMEGVAALLETQQTQGAAHGQSYH
jgi:exodeoxyribonuclease V alpha subunit